MENKWSIETRFIWWLERAFDAISTKLQHARVRLQISA